MKTGLSVHAGAAMVLSGVCLVLALGTFLPGTWLPRHSSLVLGVVCAALFPLFAGAVVRAIALATHGVRVQGNPMLLWLALRSLPTAVGAVLAGFSVLGVALLASTATGHDSRQAGKAVKGHYYASQEDGPRHEQVPVSRTEYDGLLAHDLRSMLALVGLMADLAAVSTLVSGQLHPLTRP
ncbi:hypothetical protein ACFZAU_36385 [Streptomyces sp. NPDC008238]